MTDTQRTPAVEGLVKRVRTERSWGEEGQEYVELWAVDRDALCDVVTAKDAEIAGLREQLAGFVGELTNHGRNRGTCLSINHDALNSRIVAARQALATNQGERP
jgi:hypothetical protein